MPKAWTEIDTEKLITLYGRYQCLWNSFHPEFDNKLSRYKAYKEIKNSMDISGLTICHCIEKIASMKKEYCYELSKITAAIFCEKFYTPKVKWFKEMHVLFFPYTSTSHYINYFKKQDNNERKFNDSQSKCDIQNDLLHLSSEKSKDEQICSNDICKMCKPQEIKLHLRLRGPVHSTPKLQDAFIPCEANQTVDAEAGNSGIIAERETQTDILHEQSYMARIDEEKKDSSTCTHDISVEVHTRRKIEDNFDIFGKSVAFQLRNIDTQIVVELKNKIQNLITEARMKTLESELVGQSSTSVCCCDCNDYKIMCQDETCSCGLTLKECLLLTSIKESKGFGLCFK